MKGISLSLEYEQAKRHFKASRSSENANSKENKVNSSSRKSLRPTRPVAKSSKAMAAKNRAKDTIVVGATPTPERGFEMLGLVRPSDTRVDEISKAIQTHLVESIKMSNLKSRRETSLLEMVKTLCNHLSNREDEISVWTEFADTVAKSAASKLQESLEKINRACISRDEARESAKACHLTLENIRELYISMKRAHATLKQDVEELLSTIAPLIVEMRAELGSHIDSLHSESKSEVCDAVDELSRAHNNEKKKLEAKIDSLDQIVLAGTEKIQTLQSQIDKSHQHLDGEKTKYLELQEELRGAKDKIRHMEQLLEDERIKTQNKITNMDARMNKELDDIETRVKKSFQQLSQRKDKDIAAALQRARDAEKVLEELQASLSQINVTS